MHVSVHVHVVYTFAPTHTCPQSPGFHALVTAQGYLPANIDRREETLQRKRQEYRNFIDQYYHMRSDPLHVDTFRQVGIYTHVHVCMCVCHTLYMYMYMYVISHKPKFFVGKLSAKGWE